jgi:chromosome segregation ATPase
MSQQSSEINRLHSQLNDLRRERQKYQDPLAEHTRRLFDYSRQGREYRDSLSDNHRRQFDDWERKLHGVEDEMARVIRRLNQLVGSND